MQNLSGRIGEDVQEYSSSFIKIREFKYSSLLVQGIRSFTELYFQ